MPTPRRPQKPSRFRSFFSGFAKLNPRTLRARWIARREAVRARRATVSPARAALRARRMKRLKWIGASLLALSAAAVAVRQAYESKRISRLEEQQRLERIAREQQELRREQERIRHEEEAAASRAEAEFVRREEVLERLRSDPERVRLSELKPEDLDDLIKDSFGGKSWVDMWNRLLERAKGDKDKLSAATIVRIAEAVKGSGIDDPSRMMLLLEYAFEFANNVSRESKNRDGDFTLYEGNPYEFFSVRKIAEDLNERMREHPDEADTLAEKMASLRFCSWLSKQPNGKRMIREIFDAMNLRSRE